MTIAEKLQCILNSKLDIKRALSDKELNPTNVLAEYAGLIDSLGTGASNVQIDLENGTLVYDGITYNIEELISGPICYIGKYETTTKYFETLSPQILVENSVPVKIEPGVDKHFLGNQNCLYIMVPEGYKLETYGFTNELGYQEMIGCASYTTREIEYEGVNYTLHNVRDTDFTANPEDMHYTINTI